MLCFIHTVCIRVRQAISENAQPHDMLAYVVGVFVPLCSEGYSKQKRSKLND